MYHVLEWIPVSLVQWVRPDQEIAVHEHTPHAESPNPFGVIRVYKKTVFHLFPPLSIKDHAEMQMDTFLHNLLSGSLMPSSYHI